MGMTARPLRATLYELGLQSEDPARLRRYYDDALGYRFDTAGEPTLGVAHDRRVTIAQGPSKTLAYAAFAVPDQAEIDALAARLTHADVAFERIDVAGFKPGAIFFHDPDGNGFRFGVAEQPATSAEDMAARLQHVVFASTDLERLFAFLVDVVGFTLSDRVEDDEGGLRTIFLRCSHEHHSIAVFSASESRLDHHCYEATDWNLIRDWADHFAKQRIPLKWGPGRHGPGNNLFLFIHDPDGNWLEISAELEIVEPDRPVGTWPHEQYTLNSWGIGLLRS